jgi:putative addiction module component (TIGR02574 family)
MERHAAQLLREALALPPGVRTELIDSLIESLDQTVDQSAANAWEREVERRLQEIDTGAVELLPWADARERLRKQMLG